MKELTDFKPYYFRSVYQWLVDNDLTPHIALYTNADDVIIPKHLYQETPLVLNIGPTAASDLIVGDEALTFKARFNKVSYDIYIPYQAMITIFDREGCVPPIPLITTTETEEPQPTKKKKPTLTLVK